MDRVRILRRLEDGNVSSSGIQHVQTVSGVRLNGLGRGEQAHPIVAVVGAAEMKQQLSVPGVLVNVSLFGYGEDIVNASHRHIRHQSIHENIAEHVVSGHIEFLQAVPLRPLGHCVNQARAVHVDIAGGGRNAFLHAF